jgi:HAD superfamily hydrolase (TIGR01509 family)
MKKSKIKLVVFDFNGVTVHGGHIDTMRVLGKRYHKNPNELYKLFYTKYHNLLAVKKISLRDSWEKPIKFFKLPITWQEAWKLHVNISRLNKPIVKLSQRLRKQGIKAIVVSKNVKEYWGFYQRKLKFKKYFDEIINLQDYLLPKASKKTVRFILNRYKVKSQEVIYIDDQEANLKDAKAMGVKTIYYQTYKQFKKKFDEYFG